MALTSSLISAGTGTQIFLAAGDQAITTIMFCNTDPFTDATLTVHAVANGNIVTTSTMVLSGVGLPATETFVMDTEKLILADGDSIYAISDVDSIIASTVSSVGI
jgi:hypothetical protein